MTIIVRGLCIDFVQRSWDLMTRARDFGLVPGQRSAFFASEGFLFDLVSTLGWRAENTSTPVDHSRGLDQRCLRRTKYVSTQGCSARIRHRANRGTPTAGTSTGRATTAASRLIESRPGCASGAGIRGVCVVRRCLAVVEASSSTASSMAMYVPVNTMALREASRATRKTAASSVLS